jgi:hypothetical protein
MLAPIVRHLFEHGGGHVGAQDLALASPIERMVDGARVANHLNVECAADAFPVPLNVDLYPLQRHELAWSPNVPQQSYARSFRRLARRQGRRFEGPWVLLRNAWVRKGKVSDLVTYCCEPANSSLPPVFV